MKSVLKITLGIFLGGIVLIGGCTALIAGGVKEAEDEQDRAGISIREFRAVKAGTKQQAVVRRLGKPEDAQEFEQNIPELGQSRSSCIYYPEKNKPLFEGRSFQLCFDERRLTSKNIY